MAWLDFIRWPKNLSKQATRLLFWSKAGIRLLFSGKTGKKRSVITIKKSSELTALLPATI
jgi:hypothetical protein